MRKALFSPVTSQFYNIVTNEVQMPYLDVLMQMENKGSVHGDNFSLEPKIFNNDNQLKDGAFAIPYQSNFNPTIQDYHQSGSSNCVNNYEDFMSSYRSKLAIPHFEPKIHNLQNERKRSVEVLNHEQIPLNEKRMKLSSFGQQHHSHQITEETKDCKFDMPVRRSQKLSDKITVLQKLVSPYGKTDTASVLQEASLYIKLLQEQIQNLFQMLSSSYNSLRAIHPQEIGKKQKDLRSRGLCLVPISFTQKVTKEEQLSLGNFNVI